MFLLPIILLSVTLAEPAFGIVGYDCGAKSLNITTVSLLDVENCEIPQTTINSTKVYVNLLQMNKFQDTLVKQCKVQITRTVVNCGMFSHNSIVDNGLYEYMVNVDRDACHEMHRFNSFRIDGQNIQTFRDLKMNQTTTRPITLAGETDSYGKCVGSSYSDAYGSWKNVIVQGFIKITLHEYIASINLNDDKVLLRSGTRCTLSDEHCIDSEGGNTYWESLPRDICNLHRYGSLFEGYANKIVDEKGQIVYSLTADDITFALFAKGNRYVCGYQLVGTEHPRLFIFETIEHATFASSKGITLTNLDIFVYTNSKFVFVERYIKTQINNLYRDVVMHRCRQEREIIKNSLAIASQSPDQFAYNLMKGPGYMAVLAGEVIHVVKCHPVDVKIAGGEDCYSELKVIHNNQTKYLTPKTHILKGHGTLVDCNGLLPTYFYFNDEWFKFMPRAVETKAPMTLKPFSEMTWKYQDIPTLATSGIYSEKDLEELLTRIMFPMDRPSVINDIAREMHGHAVKDQEGTIGKLLNEHAMEQLVNNTWNRMWNKFITFGTFSAGIIAIMFIVQALKKVVEVLINGVALHSIYGWSFHLFGAIWNSLTTFLIHLAKPVPEKDPESFTELASAPKQENGYVAVAMSESEEKNKSDSKQAKPSSGGYFSQG